MVQVELNDTYINIGANNGSENLLTKKSPAPRVYYVRAVERKNTCFELG